ncbi:MAG: PKD domain-containing protein [Deltaproteobacteria bacterium]|nr:PKD domain-containing protein [Deltaproteobacteria bacterium]
MRLRATLSSLSLGVLLSCAGGDVQPEPAATQPPIARLVIPHFAELNGSTLLDGALSQSPGGTLTHYRFTIGDAQANTIDSGAPRLAYTFTAEGVVAVQLEVTDLQGRTARVQGTVTVRVGAPVCSTDADCTTPEVCEASYCAVTLASTSARARSSSEE